MSLLNPYAFTPFGQPATPGVSALRAIGAPASAAQLNAARSVFGRFCAQTQLSAAPNQTTIGRLPDGTQYKIAVVGAMTTMTLWPQSDDGSDLLRSGVAIVFADLAGNPLKGYMTGGVSATYLLTPEVTKDTRIATGEWKVQKLTEPKGGGKAVNTDSTGKIYFTGLQGRDDATYPTSFADRGSVNEQAYAAETGIDVYRSGSKVVMSRDDRAPLPFVLERADGKKYAAQLVPRFHVGKSTTAMVELLVGPIKTDPDKQVGEIVATVDMPPNTIMPFWKISVHPSGRKARALSFSDGNVCKVDFEITPTSLTYVTSGCRSNTVDIKDDEPAAIINAGIEYGDGTSHEWQNIINPVRTRETTLGPSFVYAYGPKGEEFDFQIDGGKHTTVSSGYFDWVQNGVDTAPYETTYTSVRENHSSSITTSNDGGSEISEFFGHGGSYTSAERISQSKTFRTAIVANTNTIYSVNSGGGEYTETTRNSSGIIPTFFDRNVGFAIGVKYVGEAKTVTGPINSNNLIIPGTGTTTVTPGTIEVIAKHRKTGEFSILPKKTGGYGELVAFSAADPLTGSVVVNLQRRSTGPGAAVLESWIFLVDEHGVKTVQDVIPGLPQNARAKENRLLYSL